MPSALAVTYALVPSAEGELALFGVQLPSAHTCSCPTHLFSPPSPQRATNFVTSKTS
jgi:hypothetical protein